MCVCDRIPDRQISNGSTAPNRLRNYEWIRKPVTVIYPKPTCKAIRAPKSFKNKARVIGLSA